MTESTTERRAPGTKVRMIDAKRSDIQLHVKNGMIGVILERTENFPEFDLVCFEDRPLGVPDMWCCDPEQLETITDGECSVK